MGFIRMETRVEGSKFKVGLFQYEKNLYDRRIGVFIKNN